MKHLLNISERFEQEPISGGRERFSIGGSYGDFYDSYERITMFYYDAGGNKFKVNL